MPGHGQILSHLDYLATRVAGCGRNRVDGMKTLWVFAHPEPRSLNGSLREVGLQTLRELGHQVRESDLYAMHWKAAVDEDNFEHDPNQRLIVGDAQEAAHASRTLSADIRAEQEKICWADSLVLQFPMWWFGMPAILKGWFDRVFVQGFAFGIKDPRTGRTLRYGDNSLSGKRAMVMTTFGARAASMGPRGIHGDVNDLLFPLQHGILWYAGIAVVPPLLIDGANRLTDCDYDLAAKQLQERLGSLPTESTIPFRYQDRGDYDEDLVLQPGLAAGQSGLGVHYG
jgi:NAD(P)H dehydrogenase (quinone)